MRLLWLPAVLRAAGLTCHEYEGWQSRGPDSFGPVRGIVCHGTAGALTSTDAGELRVLAITGSASAPEVPISQLYLSRSGAWWVIASGTATGVRTGTGGPLEGYGDDAVLQIEAQHSKDEPWTELQYRSYVRGVAALAAHREAGYEVPLAHVIGHGEHQPGQKTDPWFDMNQFRRDVAGVMDGADMYEQTDRDTALADTWRMLTILENRPAAEYQLAGEPAPRKEPNLLKAQLDRIEAALEHPVSDEQLERVLRKVLGSLDGASPAA